MSYTTSFLTEVQQPEPTTLQNLSNIGTFIASVATIGLVIFALIQLSLLRRQVNLAEGQTEAAKKTVATAHESVETARKAVTESARARIDDWAPRIVALMENPQWPPLVDITRSGMPRADELRLWHHRSVMQSSEASPTEPFTFDRDEQWFMWFRVRGVLVNEGAGTARVRLDGEAHFIEESSTLLPAKGAIGIPPSVGTPDRNEYLLRPGEAAIFEWAYGHTLREWADAYENPNPPNPNGAGFLTITVFDYFEHGVVDYIFIETGARPIVPVPSAAGQWTVPGQESDVDQGLTVYRIQRTYASEPRREVVPPWSTLATNPLDDAATTNG
jgi:hypothetical protein